jgi:hypothetical protein
MTASIMLMLVSLVLCYSFIWYERFGVDAKRTILNLIFSLLTWTGIEFIILVTFLEWVRFVSGPMPHFPCWLHLTVKNTLAAKLMFFQTGLIISRYACIFWMKNPSACNDEFWCCFINRWVNIFSFLPHFVFAYLPGKRHTGYHMCTGADPAQDSMLPPKFNMIHYVIGFSSLAIHIIMGIRIFWYKHKIKNSVNDQSCVQKNLFLNALEKNSLSDFTTMTSGLVLLLSFGLLFFKYSQTEPQNFNSFPNYLMVYWVQLINAPFTISFILILSFARNNEMRKIMTREATDFIKQFF